MTDSTASKLLEAEELLRQYGYSVKKTGKKGRPPKIARDVAIFLARSCMSDRLGSIAAADDWIITHMGPVGLSESAHVATRERAAKQKLQGSWTMVSFGLPNGSLAVATWPSSRPPGFTPSAKAKGQRRGDDLSAGLGSWVRPTGKGWLWFEPLAEAVEIIP